MLPVFCALAMGACYYVCAKADAERSHIPACLRLAAEVGTSTGAVFWLLLPAVAGLCGVDRHIGVIQGQLEWLASAVSAFLAGAVAGLLTYWRVLRLLPHSSAEEGAGVIGFTMMFLMFPAGLIGFVVWDFMGR
jgi:hypothetical protein